MILGTSKILTFFGPIIGHFWARGPRIYGFSYTKILQQILEKVYGSILEHIIFTYMRITIFEKIKMFETQTHHFFETYFCI